MIRRPAEIYRVNLDGEHNWGHACDCVEGIWITLEKKELDDYGLATEDGNSCVSAA